MGVDHYENFPVASLLMPARLRTAVRAIYRFARTADDIADEGDDPPARRLERLDELGTELRAIEHGSPSRWPDLADAIRVWALPVALFDDLLSAFAQDVTTTRYTSYEQLRDYCRRSADPIGRLLLVLYRRSEADLLPLADAICTGLQLANFWQDVELDWSKGRVYIPQQDLERFGVAEQQIGNRVADTRWRALMCFETERARQVLRTGAPLSAALGGRAGLELKLVVHGGLRILERIDAVGGDVFRSRPTLSASDWTLMAWRALRPLAVAP